MAENKVIFSGWLKKEGGFVHNWKRRWFELRGTNLSYYTEKGGVLKGSVDLTKDSNIETTELLNQPGFTVQTAPNSRVYKIVAEKQEDRDKWVSELRNLFSPPEVNIPNKDEFVIRKAPKRRLPTRPKKD